MLGLQIQTPIRHERANEEIIDEVKSREIKVKGVAHNVNLVCSWDDGSTSSSRAVAREANGSALHER